MDEADIEAILDGEFEEDDDLDDEEEETEDDAADRLRAEITDRFDDDNSRLGLVQVYVTDKNFVRQTNPDLSKLVQTCISLSKLILYGYYKLV